MDGTIEEKVPGEKNKGEKGKQKNEIEMKGRKDRW